MCPSTWGMMTAEFRDLRVATYSVVSFTGTLRAICTLTGIACGPWACGLGSPPDRHATPIPATSIAVHTAKALKTGFFRPVIAATMEDRNKLTCIAPPRRHFLSHSGMILILDTIAAGGARHAGTSMGILLLSGRLSDNYLRQ